MIVVARYMARAGGAGGYGIATWGERVLSKSVPCKVHKWDADEYVCIPLCKEVPEITTDAQM